MLNAINTPLVLLILAYSIPKKAFFQYRSDKRGDSFKKAYKKGGSSYINGVRNCLHLRCLSSIIYMEFHLKNPGGFAEYQNKINRGFL
jgi:hypothetical protein